MRSSRNDQRHTTTLQQGYETLWNLSNSNHKAFWDNPSHDELRHSLEVAIATKGEAPELLYEGEITLNADVNPLNDADLQDDTTDAKNAPAIRAALPEITPARAADHRLWASVNCFALLPYAAKRWNQSSSAKAPRRTSEEKKLREWVQEHFLGHGADMKQNNAAARLWWLTEMASRAAAHSIHDTNRLLSAMANDVEMYHQLLSRPYIASNPRIVALIYDMAMDGNDYLFKRPYPNRMLQNLNVKAAAVSLGTLTDETLKAVVEEAKPPKEREATA